MKRNMDTIRTLLLRLENIKIPPGAPFVLINGNSEGIKIHEADDPAELDYHLELLKEKGLIRSPGTNNIDNRIRFGGFTWEGHDFLDSIRDDEVWRKTKGAVEAAGGWTLDLLAALAKGLIRKQIEDRTGLKL
jgi:Hypothetical protein (DUF2513)